MTKTSITLLVGLLLIFPTYVTIASFGEEAKDKTRSDANHDYMSEKIVAELEQKADRLQKVAEDQKNSDALSLIQQAKDLIEKAKQMISDKNYEGAKQLLRDAYDLLNKAGMILKGDSTTTNPVPGQGGQTSDHPQNSPVYGDKPTTPTTISLVGSGTATETGKGETSDVSAQLDLSAFRRTPHMLLLKVTDGFITIGNASYTVEQGKALIAMKAHKMILTVSLSSDDGTHTERLRLFGTMQNSQGNTSNTQTEDVDTATSGIHTITLRGKLAQLFLNIDAEIS